MARLKSKAAMQAAIPEDRNEHTSQMEPLLLSDSAKQQEHLYDLVLELTAKSSGFCRSLPAAILPPLAELVRSMNCYYSNLMEGHDTHPVEIERALRGDYSQDSRKRDLQTEAKAHIQVQRWIDSGGIEGDRILTIETIREIHRRFCEALPEDLLWSEDPITKERLRVLPGELRNRDVRVGDHIAISPGSLPRFLQRFEQVYTRLGKTELLIANAAIHHRLLWLHPFLDGNGRVARLVSHAVFLNVLHTNSLWSVARGLARNLNRYKALLANCDRALRNDLDGRGQLSQEALANFTRFFLEVCLDQVRFMESLVQPDRLRARILQWAGNEVRLGTLPGRQSVLFLEAILYRGELPRGELPSILQVSPRQARRVVSALVDQGVLTSETPRAPIRLAFPARLTAAWMPGLFPDAGG